MGTFWENSEMTREEVINNIKEINKLTKMIVFMNKFKLHLKFELDDSPIQKITKKIIKVIISDYNEKTCFIKTRKNPIFISIDDFYKYYNSLMNFRREFLNQHMQENMNNLTKSQIGKLGEDESSICPICCENNVSMSLPCSHFFCDGCIKSWLIKSESCPLCRYKLTVNRKNPTGIKGGQTWNVIDDIDIEQVVKENEESLNRITNKLFFSKND